MICFKTMGNENRGFIISVLAVTMFYCAKILEGEEANIFLYTVNCGFIWICMEQFLRIAKVLQFYWDLIWFRGHYHVNFVIQSNLVISESMVLRKKFEISKVLRYCMSNTWRKFSCPNCIFFMYLTSISFRHIHGIHDIDFEIPNFNCSLDFCGLGGGWWGGVPMKIEPTQNWMNPQCRYFSALWSLCRISRFLSLWFFFSLAVLLSAYIYLTP